jgi:hypothetical protein
MDIFAMAILVESVCCMALEDSVPQVIESIPGDITSLHSL